jgi:hypothetical protein
MQSLSCQKTWSWTGTRREAATTTQVAGRKRRRQSQRTIETRLRAATRMRTNHKVLPLPDQSGLLSAPRMAASAKGLDLRKLC